MLLELGIPNLLCGCILGWQSLVFQFLGQCDLDLVSRIIMSRAYLLHYSMHHLMVLCHCYLDL